MIGTPDGIYYNYLNVYHWDQKMGDGMVSKKAEENASIITIPHLHQSMLGDLAGTTWYSEGS